MAHDKRDRARDSVQSDLRVSLNDRGFSCSLFARFLLAFCVVYAVHEAFYILTEPL